MYETYWQLDQKPFENAADTRFFFPGETHQSALLKLRYAVENRRGGALLTGAAGTGKNLYPLHASRIARRCLFAFHSSRLSANGARPSCSPIWPDEGSMAAEQ